MHISLLLFICLMQFVVQLTIYLIAIRLLYITIHRMTKSLCFMAKDKQNAYDICNSVQLLCLNIIISYIVLCFTGVSAYAGISNTFASAFLGVLMWYQFKKGGKYYLEYTPPKPRVKLTESARELIYKAKKIFLDIKSAWKNKN